MNIAIIDDDLLFAKLLESKLFKIFPDAHIAIYTNITSSIYDKTYDIVFLDILFKEEKSFEFGKKLLEISNKTKLVYMSCIKEFIYDSYVQDILYFIRKEYLDIDLDIFFKKYTKKYGNLNGNISIYYNGCNINIPINKIMYIESLGNKIIITTCNNKYEIYGSLKKIHELINSRNFYRFNSYTIINFTYLKNVEKYGIEMNDNKVFTYTRNSKKRFVENYINYKEY